MAMKPTKSTFIEAEKNDSEKLNSENTNRYEKAVVSIVGLLADCTAAMYKTSKNVKK